MLQPGCVNTTEVDIKKACRMSKPASRATKAAAAAAAMVSNRAKREELCYIMVMTYVYDNIRL